jgi:hypothetical protein
LLHNAIGAALTSSAAAKLCSSQAEIRITARRDANVVRRSS